MSHIRHIFFLGSTIGITCLMISLNYFWTRILSSEMRKQSSRQCISVLSIGTITPLHDSRTFVIAPYYDNREKDQIRILSIIHSKEVKNLYCLFCCTLNNLTHISKAEIDLHEDRFGFPYGLADVICPEPPGCEPNYISLHQSPDKDITHQPKFRIKNREPGVFTANFTVCISTMFGNYSNTLQFIQTIEMYKLLGAQRVMIYLHSCSPQMEEVLKYYIKEGVVEVVPWPIDRYLKPSKSWLYPNDDTHIGYYGQVTTLNDCIYRNMYRSKFVLLNDIDEIILPFKHDNWDSMMESLEKQHPEVGIFLFENHIFPITVTTDGHFSDISNWINVPGINIMQHVHREPDRPDFFNAKKMIVNPRKVIQTSVHSALKSYGHSKEISTETALVYHCRGPLQAKLPKESLIEDKTIWRYSNSLIRNVNAVLNQFYFQKIPT
ncbi:glycosyltransferase family 92 protein F13G3.3-like [Bombina bombina]|uniref:glycosyltransferase family 92 protein F13G3.3-like n=1 Tax=Bombina bombina TaxID=8345 RepID=UPI00235AC2F6|nr:glycosyltransferase family 92 protein F13G3.3-like [Bombina bombina]